MEFKVKINKSTIAMLLVLPILAIMITSIGFNMELSSAIFLLFLSYLLSVGIITAIISTKYILEEDRVIICSMGFERNVLYKDINYVNERYKCLSIEAPSAPQVCIVKKDKTIVKIAPDGRENFIEVLNAKRFVNNENHTI